MSNFISAFRLPNYEDNQHYGQTSCRLKHWPDLWPEEDYAEKAVREWLKELWEWPLLHPIDRQRDRKQLQAFALVQLCDERGWDVYHVTDEGRELYKIYPDEP